MRKLLPAVLLWSTAISIGGPAFAQITLVPGQAFVVPARPKQITSADFNGDNLADAAVLNVGSNKVTVLLATAGGTFGTLNDYDVARGLQHLAAGDLNGDGRPDIAVLTSLERGSVYGLFSSDNSTFLKSQRLAGTAGRQPKYLAVADLNGANGNDFITADQSSDTVSIMLNRGNNLGFADGFTEQAGGRPIAVAIADVDLDGSTDILTLNTQASAADSVGVLRSTGTGDFLPPVPFTVGNGARALIVTDLNRDNAPDVLVLNSAKTTSANTFSVSVLLNNRPIPGTTDPLFSTLLPVPVACPSTIGGIPIMCTPTSMVSADFDQDGFADFVVSAQTEPVSSLQELRTGLLLAYGGNGDGTFSFATQATIGLRPKGQAVGDFNGDLVPDIAVAEEGERSVRVVLSLPPDKREVGAPCNLATQCASAHCVDNACCNVSQCPAGQFCSIPGSEGSCAVALDNGLACTAGAQCTSGNCVDGYCCGSQSCPAGQSCNTGACRGPAPDGSRCNTPNQCASQNCVDGTCCNSARCAFGERCDVPTSPGVCTGLQPIGNPCTSPSQCESTFCVDGACCGVSSCPAGQSCGIPGQSGACSVLPTATITPTATATPTSTPTPQPLGATCTAGSQCVSGACVDGVCCASSSCPAGQACDVFSSPGSCTPLKTDGQECRTDGDCLSGNCQAGTPPVCVAPRTPTPTRTASPTPTATPLANGQFCLEDNDCQSTFCTDGFCCGSRSCPEGQACNIEGREGTCSAPKPTGGQSCNPGESSPCAGGLYCNPDSVCCQTATCPEGQRCDITGKEGRCASASGTGSQCSKNTDCQSGLECRLDVATETFRCLPPRTPTPTLIPQPTATRVGGGTTVTSTRSGGCSIADPGSDSSSAWLLAALPVAFGLRRRALATARGGRRQ